MRTHAGRLRRGGDRVCTERLLCGIEVDRICGRATGHLAHGYPRSIGLRPHQADLQPAAIEGWHQHELLRVRPADGQVQVRAERAVHLHRSNDTVVIECGRHDPAGCGARRSRPAARGARAACRRCCRGSDLCSAGCSRRAPSRRRSRPVRRLRLPRSTWQLICACTGTAAHSTGPPAASAARPSTSIEFLRCDPVLRPRALLGNRRQRRVRVNVAGAGAVTQLAHRVLDVTVLRVRIRLERLAWQPAQFGL